MRDKLIHHYFGIDYDAIFLTITEEIPILKKEINNYLSSRRKLD
ncbi:HepT-like ribonuclease domain-containing protein [Methanospirillum stamsii]|nr:HepT-like ribonuclease domain-containing protein [Methanospirillum stamsii]